MATQARGDVKIVFDRFRRFLLLLIFERKEFAMGSLSLKMIYTFLLLFLLILSCPFFTSVSFGETALWSLNQCVQKSIANDPEIKKLKGKIDLGDIKTREAIQRFFPLLNLELSYAPLLDFFGNLITDENIFRSGISIQQPIYRGGGLVTTYKLTKSEALQNLYQYQLKAQEAAYNTAKEFYHTLSAREALRLNQELHLKSERLLSIARQAYGMGLATKVDFLEAEKNFYDTKYKILKAEQEYQLALMNLKKVMGVDPGEDLAPWEEGPIKPVGQPLEGLVEEGSRRVDIRYNEENVNFTKLKVKLNKSKELPTVSLFGGYDYTGPHVPGDRRGWNVGIQCSISLFNSTLSASRERDYLYENPFAVIRQDDRFNVTKGKLSLNDGSSSAIGLEEARIEKRFAEDKLSQSKREAALEVKEAYFKLKQTESLIETGAKAVEAAEEKYRVISFRHGLREATYKDLIEAQVDLTEAKVNQARTIFDRSVALAGLYKAIGKDVQWD
jgi:outer membrane protein TolC